MADLTPKCRDCSFYLNVKKRESCVRGLLGVSTASMRLPNRPCGPTGALFEAKTVHPKVREK